MGVSDKLKLLHRYKVKHILKQPPAEDTSYKAVLKNYFCLKKGFIVVSLTGIWKFLMPVLCENFAGD